MKYRVFALVYMLAAIGSVSAQTLPPSTGELINSGLCGGFKCSPPTTSQNSNLKSVNNFTAVTRMGGDLNPDFIMAWEEPDSLTGPLGAIYSLLEYEVYVAAASAYEHYRVDDIAVLTMKLRDRTQTVHDLYARAVYESSGFGTQGIAYSPWQPIVGTPVSGPLTVGDLDDPTLIPAVDADLLACIESQYADSFLIESMTSLSCIQAGIDDIDGLQHLSSLFDLFLYNTDVNAPNPNTITDLSSLTILPDLYQVDVSQNTSLPASQLLNAGAVSLVSAKGNGYISIPDLSETAIESLSFDDNNVTSLIGTVLPENLNALILDGNPINNAAYQSATVDVPTLSLRRTLITDASVASATIKNNVSSLYLDESDLTNSQDFTGYTALCQLSINDISGLTSLADVSGQSTLPPHLRQFYASGNPALSDIGNLATLVGGENYVQIDLNNTESVECPDVGALFDNVANPNNPICPITEIVSFVDFTDCMPPIAPLQISDTEVVIGESFDLIATVFFDDFHIGTTGVEQCTNNCGSEANWSFNSEQPGLFFGPWSIPINRGAGEYQFRNKVCSEGGQCSVSVPVTVNVRPIESLIELEHIWVNQQERTFKLAWRLPAISQNPNNLSPDYFRIRPGLAGQPPGTTMPADVLFGTSVGNRMWQSAVLDADDYLGAVYTVASCSGSTADGYCAEPQAVNLQTSPAGSNLADVSITSAVWTGSTSTNFQLTWTYDTDYLCSTTGKPDFFQVVSAISGEEAGRLNVTSTNCPNFPQSFWQIVLDDALTVGSSYTLAACQNSGECGELDLVTLIPQDPPPPDLPEPNWSVGNTSAVNGQMTLSWNVSGPGAGEVDYYRVTEADAQTGVIRHQFYTEDTDLKVERVFSGEYRFDVAACRRIRASNEDDECTNDAPGNVTLTVPPQTFNMATPDPAVPHWDDVTSDPGVFAQVRLRWSYPQAVYNEPNGTGRPDFFKLTNSNSVIGQGERPAGVIDYIDASNGDGNYTWESSTITLDTATAPFFPDQGASAPPPHTYTWQVYACKNANEPIMDPNDPLQLLGYGICGDPIDVVVDFNSPPAGDAPDSQDYAQETLFWDQGGTDPNAPPTTPGGPDDLTPGSWWDPERAGTGWNFYWASELRYPQVHEQYGESYDLIAIWYTYAQLPYGVGGNLEWAPVWFYSLMKLDGSEGNEYFEGTLFYPNKVTGSDLCDNDDCAVGSLRVYFGEEVVTGLRLNYQAEVNMTINSSNGFAGIASADFDLQYLASDESLIDLGLNDCTLIENPHDHYSGLWWEVNGGNVNSDYSIQSWVISWVDTQYVTFYDSIGHPIWARASFDGRTADGSSGMGCGTQPHVNRIVDDWLHNPRLNIINRGFNPILTTPEGYDPVNHRDDVGFINRAYNTSGTDLNLAGLRTADFNVQAVSDINSSSPRTFNLSLNTSLDKAASFHDVRFSVNDVENADTCEMELVNGQLTCEMELSWFTDAEYPGLTVYLYDINNDTYSLVAAANSSNGFYPTQVDYAYAITNLGDYRFELWKEPNRNLANNALIAVSEDLSVVNDVNTGEGTMPEVPPMPVAMPTVVEDISSTQVSVISGNFRVDESGSATYTIPIVTAPGSGGVVPQLSLGYSHQAPNGPLGLGWGISGQSSIVRCGQTLEAGDGRMSGVQLTDDDRLCLDGQRLINISNPTNYWLPGSEYRTEVESFVQVVLVDPADGSDDYFEVRRRDGSISEYGGTTGSRIDAGFGDGTIYAWAMNRFKDSASNYIDYSYFHPDGNPGQVIEYYLDNVAYTGNLTKNQDPYANVDFIWELKPAAERHTSFMAGATVRQDYRLQAVDSIGESGDQLRKYEPTYSTDALGRSIITAIDACVDSICQLATTFAWNQNISEIISSENSLQEIDLDDTDNGEDWRNGFTLGYPVDINGDGMQDVMYLDADGSLFEVHLVISEQTQQAGQGPNHRFNQHVVTEKLPGIIFEDGSNFITVGDYNSDGLQDLIYTDRVSWFARSWNGSTLASPVNIGQFLPAGTNSSPGSMRFVDLNADGVGDLIYSSGSTLYVNLNEGSGTQRFISPSPIDLNIDIAYTGPYIHDMEPEVRFNRIPFQIFDYNGDGLVDVMLRVDERHCELEFCSDVPPSPTESTRQSLGDQQGYLYVSEFEALENLNQQSGGGGNQHRYIGWHLFVSEGGGQFAQGIELLHETCEGGYIPCGSPAAANNADEHLRLADLNNDGYTDFIYRNFAGNWTHQLGTGLDFTSSSLFAALNVETDNSDLELLDYNGDNYVDVLFRGNLENDPDDEMWQVVFNSPSGFSATPTLLSGVRAGNIEEEGERSIFLDANGDGRIDQIFIKRDTNIIDGQNNIVNAFFNYGHNSLWGDSNYSNAEQYLQPHTVIAEITNGFGAKTKITYGSLSDRSVYSPNRNRQTVQGARSPVYDITPSLFVVSQVASSSPHYELNGDLTTSTPRLTEATGGEALVEYHYSGAKVQGGGRGFLGFERVASFDVQSSIRSVNRYRQDFPFIGVSESTHIDYIPLAEDPWTRVVFQSPPGACNCDNDPFANGISLSTTTQTWSSATSDSGLTFLYISQTDEEKYVPVIGATEITGSNLVSTITSINSNYDIFGNLRSGTITTKDSSGGIVASQTTTNTFDNFDQGKWQLGRLRTAAISHSRPGRTTINREMAYEYDALTGILTKEIDEPNNPLFRIETTYQLDDFGNRTHVIIDADDILPRTSYVIFDDRGRYPDESYDALNQRFEKITSRDRFGNALSIIDIEGIETSYQYDSLGKLYFQYNPTGAWIESYSRVGAGNICPVGNTAFYTETIAGGQGINYECFDVVGRIIRSVSPGLKEGLSGLDRLIYQDTHYDHSGRGSEVSEPYYKNDSIYWTRTVFDEIGRPYLSRIPNCMTNDCLTSMDYEVLTTITINALGQLHTEVMNELGEKVLVLDNAGNSISYDYDAVGNLIETDGAIAGSSDLVIMQYDLIGRYKISMTDPDKGTLYYQHDALGQLICRLDANDHAVMFSYDGLGRKVSQIDYKDVLSVDDCSAGTQVSMAEWDYIKNDSTVNGYGQIGHYLSCKTTAVNCSIVSQDYTKTDFSYDMFGRLSISITEVNTNSGLESWMQEATYDEYGRVFQRFDAAGDDAGLRMVYNNDGHLIEEKEAAYGVEGEVYFRIRSIDARGQAELVDQGASTVTKQYEGSTGRVVSIQAQSGVGGVIQDLSYDFDYLGNLNYRHDQSGSKDLREDFVYDVMNRLQEVRLTAPVYGIIEQTTQSLRYNESGNILCRLDDDGCIGTTQTNHYYGEQGAGPHALSRISGGPIYTYDDSGNQISSTDGRAITYTLFDKAENVSDGGTTAFAYDANRSRFKREDSDSGKTTYYLGNVEVIRSSNGSTTIKRYLAGVAIEDRHQGASGSPVANPSIKYTLKDHLGSLDIVTDSNGVVLEEVSFDSWGNYRNASDWRLSLLDISNLLNVTTRGFTGHETIANGNLIHMGGRIYDPEVGRFLQADPFIQDALSSQSHNRYSYVFNNPLSGVDPSGYFGLLDFAKIVAAVAITVYSGGAASGAWGFFGIALEAGSLAAFSVVAAGGFVSGALTSGSLLGSLKGAFLASATYAITLGIDGVINGAGTASSSSAESAGIAGEPAAVETAKATNALEQASNVASGSAASNSVGVDAIALPRMTTYLNQTVTPAGGNVWINPVLIRSVGFMTLSSYLHLQSDTIEFDSGVERSSLRNSRQRLADALGIRNGEQPWALIQEYHNQLATLRFARGVTTAMELAIPIVGIPGGGGGKFGVRVAIDPKKFDYLFGRVVSSGHSADRSVQLAKDFRRLGIYDDAVGRSIIRNHLDDVVKQDGNILRVFTNKHGNFEIRESFLIGPSGKAAKLSTGFQVLDDGTRLFNTTIIKYSGNPFKGGL